MSPVLSQFAVPLTSVHRVKADGVDVFYRAAGDPSAPVVLLLHGYPTSSFMFRELIPRLADRYRVVAPELAWFWIYAGARGTQLQVFVRRIGENNRGLHGRARPHSVCDLCFRLRGAHRLSPGHGSSRTGIGDRFSDTAMPTKRDWAMHGDRFANIGLSRPQKTAT